MPPPNHIEIHQTLEKVDLAAYKKKMLKVAWSKFFANGKTNGYGQSYQSADGGGWIVVATSRKNKNMENNTSDKAIFAHVYS